MFHFVLFSSTASYSTGHHCTCELQPLNTEQRKLEREVSRRQQFSYLLAIPLWLFKFIPEAPCNMGLPLPVPVQSPNQRPRDALTLL